MQIDDIDFVVTEIPSIGGKFKYAAKVQYLYIKDQKGRRKVEHDFGEIWGQSKDEAENKMRKHVQAWITSHEDEI
jgi:hypothetical protein